MKEDKEIQTILNTLSLLEPSATGDKSTADEALAKVRARIAAEERAVPSPNFVTSLWRRIETVLKSRQAKQRFAVGAVLAVLVASLLIFPGARAVASDLLGIFRVQRFAPISVSPEQIARLQALDVEGLRPGTIDMIEEPGEPQAVDSLDEAGTAAGMWVYSLEGALGAPDEIAVTGRGSGRLTVDLESARAILEAAEIDPALLPDSLDGAEVTVNISPLVFQRWTTDSEVVFIQGLSPELNYPDGFDPTPIGQAVLQLLGMGEDDAYRLAQAVDWNSTLILPIPTELATFSEVQVNGTIGLLVEEVGGGHQSLIWQNGGRIYMVTTEGTERDIVELAESLG